MTHFICTGECKGISDNPGVCQDSGCPRFGKELEACECTDNKHNGKQDGRQNVKNEEGEMKNGEDPNL